MLSRRLCRSSSVGMRPLAEKRLPSSEYWSGFSGSRPFGNEAYDGTVVDNVRCTLEHPPSSHRTAAKAITYSDPWHPVNTFHVGIQLDVSLFLGYGRCVRRKNTVSVDRRQTEIGYSSRLPLGSHGAASDHQMQKSQANKSSDFFHITSSFITLVRLPCTAHAVVGPTSASYNSRMTWAATFSAYVSNR